MVFLAEGQYISLLSIQRDYKEALLIKPSKDTRGAMVVDRSVDQRLRRRSESDKNK